jgi:hypothetical protein
MLPQSGFAVDLDAGVAGSYASREWNQVGGL